MRTLFVEDNPRKREHLLSFYEAEFGQDTVRYATALISGLRLAREFEPNLIILDMTLPNYSTEESKGAPAELLPFAGKEFVMRIHRMGFPTRIVIVSMFETFGIAPRLITLSSLDEELKSRYPRIYTRAVHYSPSDVDWQIGIKEARAGLEE